MVPDAAALRQVATPSRSAPRRLTLASIARANARGDDIRGCRDADDSIRAQHIAIKRPSSESATHIRSLS
eukprot:339978-Pyramimonas_sp.AAC.1